jgi:hypothetical protein
MVATGASTAVSANQVRARIATEHNLATSKA